MKCIFLAGKIKDVINIKLKNEQLILFLCLYFFQLVCLFKKFIKGLIHF